MALTVSRVSSYVAGNKRHRVCDVTFDSSYADNGESLAASDVGLNKVEQVVGSIARHSDGSKAIVVSYDYTNSKLLAFLGAADAADAPFDEAGAIDLSAYTARLTFVGY